MKILDSDSAEVRKMKVRRPNKLTNLHPLSLAPH